MEIDWHEIERLRDALRLIAKEKCENYTKPWRCWDDGMGRTRGGRYGAESWCGACIAQDALNGGLQSRVPLTPEEEEMLPEDQAVRA